MDKHLSIAIVGAGLGGLFAALRLYQDGHSIQLFERRNQLSDKGGGLIIRPNATRHLIRWGLKEVFESVSADYEAGAMRDLMTGHFMQKVPADRYSHFPTWSMLRQDVQRILFESLKGLKDVQMRFGTEVVGLSEGDGSDPSLTLCDGSVVQSDLIIVADGVRSQLRDQILEDCFRQTGPIKPLISPLTAHQTQLPSEDVRQNDSIGDVFLEPGTTLWLGKGRIVVTGGVSTTSFCVAIFIVDEGVESTMSSEDATLWEENGDIEYLRGVFEGIDPRLGAWLESVKTCDRWKLCELPNLPRWSSAHGRIILLGDAAHAMLPNGGQGASQIVEDVAILSHLISKLKDHSAPVNSIPTVAKIYEDVRKPRFERIREYCRDFQTIRGPESEGEVGDQKSGIDADFASENFRKWMFDHDVLEGLDELWQERAGSKT